MEVSASPAASTSPDSTYLSGTASSTRLGCGRTIDDVWDNVESPPTPHEMTCPYCRAARSDLTDLAKATRDLHEQDTTDPDLQADPEVLERILAIARSEVRRGRRLPLDRVGPGRVSDLTVSEQTVAALIRRSGDRTGDIQIRRCAIESSTAGPNHTPADTTRTTMSGAATIGPARVSISLRVSTARTLPIVRAVEELRQAIIDVVDREVGMIVTNVHVTVEDIHDA